MSCYACGKELCDKNSTGEIEGGTDGRIFRPAEIALVTVILVGYTLAWFIWWGFI